MAEGIYFDDDEEPDPVLNGITNRIIGAAIAVHKELGPGYDEHTYENSLAIEFNARGIRFQRQVIIDIYYRGEKVGRKKLDFIVESTVVLEIKAVDELAPIFSNQVVSYLKATKLRLGLLINFNVKQLIKGIRRIAN